MSYVEQVKSVIDFHNNGVAKVLQESDQLKYDNQKTGFLEEQTSKLKKEVLSKLKELAKDLKPALKKAKQDRLNNFYPNL